MLGSDDFVQFGSSAPRFAFAPLRASGGFVVMQSAGFDVARGTTTTVGFCTAPACIGTATCCAGNPCTSAWFTVRCVYDRPKCGVLAPSIVSEPTAQLLNSATDDGTRWLILLASPEFQLK